MQDVVTVSSHVPRRRRSTSSDEAYGRVRAQIISGALMPGDLVVEERLAAELDVSRTPVREALLRLEREQLLERSGRSLSVRLFSPDEIADIFTLRAHVESYGARLATQRAMDHELNELEHIDAQMAEATERHRATRSLDDLRAITQLNERFHRLVIRASRSQALERTVNDLILMPLLYRSQQSYDDLDRSKSSGRHHELLEHMRARRAAAAERCWRDHLTEARDRILAKQLATDSIHQPSA